MNRNTKKGFTIVELIIVIAVIAVLAAVLIPTFSNLINQAQQAKDTALVSDLNKGLKMSGKNFDTMHDALTAVEENVGINVAKINAVATDSEILWDSVNQCFVYLKGGDTEPTYIPDSKTTDVKGDYDYWMISDKDADVKADKYSIYWNGADLETITATTGFDAGEKNVAKILYQRADDAAAREVTIRTNGGELEVAAKTDKVHHFDIAQQVLITKSAPHSYYENGTVVGNLEVVEGHVEISAKASVTTVIVASETENAATVTVASGATVGVVGAKTEEGQKYLEKATTVPTDKKAPEQLDGSVLSLFAGGIGTEASPYLINNMEQWCNLAKNSNYADSLSMQGKYFSVNCDLDFADVAKQVQIKRFNGHITFNGHTVKNLKIDSTHCPFIHYGCYAFLFATVDGDSTISDIVFVVYSPAVDYATKLVGFTNYYNSTEPCNVELKSVVVEGVARYSDNNTGMFVYCAGLGTVRLENCINYANLFNAESYTGVFVGRTYVDFGSVKSQCTRLVFSNCKNYGTVISTSNVGETHVLLSNIASMNDTEITVDNCINYGTIIAKNIKIRENVINKGLLSSSSYEELSTKDGKFLINSVEGAERYELVFAFSGAAAGGGVASQTFVLTEADLSSVDAFEWIDKKDVEGQQITSVSKYGTTVRTCNGKYVYTDDAGTYVKKQPAVTLVVYGANDSIISLATYNYAV